MYSERNGGENADSLPKGPRRGMPTLTTLIGNRLGRRIEPTQIGLIPATDDGYAWATIPEKKYLFTKQFEE
jgi:hypothetical protein